MHDSQAKPARSYHERTFFQQCGQKRIYMAEFVPDQPIDRRHGVVLCKPIWGERIRTHRIYTNFGRTLAALGYHVITCDYYGDGNSAGDSLELDIPGMSDDVVQMSAGLTERFGLTKTAVAGMLIGANVAYLSGSRIKNLEKMILIQPVLNPIEHLETALRSNLSTQMVVHKKVIKDRNTLISEIKSGIPVNVDGFMLGKRLWASYEAISPLKDLKSDFAGEAAIISLKKKAAKGADYTLLQKNFRNAKIIEIEQEFVWTDWKVYKPRPPLLFQALRAEIESIDAK